MMSCPMNSDTSGEGEVVYNKYLQLDKILGAQKRESEKDGRDPEHDEHFFIVIHQAYELWFKQSIWELESVRELLQEGDLTKQITINDRVGRVVAILKLAVDQIKLLETLQPVDFMRFRSYLSPASGFQSYQFRILENMIGLKKQWRSAYGQEHYRDAHQPDVIDEIEKSEKDTSLLSGLERWLERCFESESAAGFWNIFQEGVIRKLKDMDPNYGKQTKETENGVKPETGGWETIISEKAHNVKVKYGERRLSYKAWQGALLITYKRKTAEFSNAHQLLLLVQQLDNILMKWRYHHVQMVHRMIGNRAGTGGTVSGYGYLKSTLGDSYGVFRDLFDLNGFLIEPHYCPDLYN